MADFTFAAQAFNRVAGLTPSYKSDMSATDTYFVPNDGRTVIHLKNTGGSNSVVTVVTPGTVDGSAVADKTYTVPLTTGDLFIGPFPANTYNVAGAASFTLTNADDVSCAVFTMPVS